MKEEKKENVQSLLTSLIGAAGPIWNSLGFHFPPYSHT